MREYVYPYAESFENGSERSTEDVYGGGSDVRHSFSGSPVGHAASPIVHTPLYSFRGTLSSPLVGSHNGQSPIHESSYGQPSPEVYGSTSEHFPKDKGKNHGETIREARHWQKGSNGYQKDPEQCRSETNRSIRLFQCLKDLKKYDEAEELYHEISEKNDVGEELLGLKHAFAEMLIEQQKFQEAEPIFRAVWEERKSCPGLPLEDSQKSHRQLCSVLRALKKFKDAERMHNDMYQRKPKDEWALENGDEVCQTLKEQKQFQKAKALQEEVWKTRLENNSRSKLTIQSGMRLIGFLEELNKPVDYEGGTDAEKRLASSARQFLKDELEVILRKIWQTRLQPEEPNANILDVGHKLGDRLIRDGKFLEAEGVLQIVWENKKRELGEDNDSTMSSGSMLGSTICRQGKQEHYQKAVKILEPIWRQMGTKRCDAGALSIFKDLAQAQCSLGNLWHGECVYRWIWQQKHQDGYLQLEVDEALWDLGGTLYKQGRDKDPEVVSVLGDVYRRWQLITHNPDETLKCGQMLAQSLSSQDGRIDEALKVAQGVFEKREVSEERGVAYLESAQLYGSLLLKLGRHEDAGSVLRLGWECQPGKLEEQKLRLKCGHLLGQALAGRHKYTFAKKILEAVAADQKGVPPTVSPEVTETRRLLKEVIRQGNGWKKGLTKARPKVRSGI